MRRVPNGCARLLSPPSMLRARLLLLLHRYFDRLSRCSPAVVLSTLVLDFFDEVGLLLELELRSLWMLPCLLAHLFSCSHCIATHRVSLVCLSATPA